jgi:hypothetical protein
MARKQAVKLVVAGAIVALGLVFSGGVVAAQDAATTAPSHPAFIKAGDCGESDANPVATLNDLERIGSSEGAGDEEELQVEGTLTAAPILTSTSEEIEVSFDELLETSHSVTVYLSQDELQTYVACGEIGGVVNEDQLVIALHAVDGSDYNGIAILAKDGDGNADVTVYLAGPSESDSAPDATPAS